MTTPVGAPDWLKTVPGAAKSLSNANYSAATSNIATVGVFNVQAYRSIVVQWAPLQAQALFLEFYDDAALTSLTIRRTLTAVNPATGWFTIPTLGSYVLISAFRFDSANNPTGHLSAIGVSSADRNAASRGPLILRSNLSQSAGAGATVFDNCTAVGEGLATIYWRCTGAVFVLQLAALDPTNTWTVIAEATNTDISPARFSVQVPGYQLRLNFTNSDAAVRAVGWMITVGD